MSQEIGYLETAEEKSLQEFIKSLPSRSTIPTNLSAKPSYKDHSKNSFSIPPSSPLLNPLTTSSNTTLKDTIPTLQLHLIPNQDLAVSVEKLPYNGFGKDFWDWNGKPTPIEFSQFNWGIERATGYMAPDASCGGGPKGGSSDNNFNKGNAKGCGVTVAGSGGY